MLDRLVKKLKCLVNTVKSESFVITNTGLLATSLVN